VDDVDATGFAKQTPGKEWFTPEYSRGAGLATVFVPGTAETTQESLADVDVAPGVVTHINGEGGSTPGEEDAGRKPGCVPPSKSGRARPPSADDVDATEFAKQTPSKEWSTPE